MIFACYCTLFWTHTSTLDGRKGALEGPFGVQARLRTAGLCTDDQLTHDPGKSFLMVAIRNLYWTERIVAFIVGGLILASTLCGVVGAAPGGVRAAGPNAAT